MANPTKSLQVVSEWCAAPWRGSLRPSAWTTIVATSLLGPGCLFNVQDGDDDVIYESSPGGSGADTTGYPGGPATSGGTSGVPGTSGGGVEGGSTWGPSEPPPDQCGNAENVVADPGFERGSQGAWSQSSYLFDSVICDTTCTTDDEVFAHRGQGWLWLGGSNYQEVASVSQPVVFQGEAASLSFYLSIQAVQAVARDTLTVSIDGTTVFAISGTEVGNYDNYTGIRVDVSAFADGEPHELMFEADLTGIGQTSFFLDEVSLTACDLAVGATGPETGTSGGQTGGTTGDDVGTSSGDVGDGSTSGVGEGSGTGGEEDDSTATTSGKSDDSSGGDTPETGGSESGTAESETSA